MYTPGEKFQKTLVFLKMCVGVPSFKLQKEIFLLNLLFIF